MDWYYSSEGKPVGPLSADDIESLFVTGQINANTLVWRKGMDQWAQLADVDEFSTLQADHLPPPLPPSPPQPPAFEPRLSDADLMVSEREADEESVVEPEARPEHVQSYVQPKLAGPWTRYFARSLDLSIIATILMTAAFLVLPYVSPALYLQAYAADARVLFLLALPFAHIVNVIIITLFGNSLGKAIFAIKAMPLDGRAKFTFRENLGREFRVWTEGLALGIPIVNFFTMVPAYRKVAAGEPAPYDLRKAMVRSFSDNKVRRTIGMLLAAAVFLLIAFSNALDKMALEDLAEPTSWRNPQTQITTTIPGNWQYELVPGPDGASLYGFTNLKTGVVALLGVETAANLDLQAYSDALKSGLASSTSLGAWQMSSIPSVWKASGQMSPDGYPSTIYVTQLGTSFWRIVYVDQLNKGAREIVEPQMTDSLLRSVGLSR